MAKDDPHFRLRIPADLKARVEESAKRSNRSINAEIVAVLEEKFPPPAGFDLGTFLTNLGKSAAAAADDMKEVGRLVREGNAELERNGAEWRVTRSFENNKTRLTIVHRDDLPSMK